MSFSADMTIIFNQGFVKHCDNITLVKAHFSFIEYVFNSFSAADREVAFL